MYKAISCLQKVHPVLSATRTFSYRFPRGIWVYLLSVQKNSTFSIEPLKHWRNKGRSLLLQSRVIPALQQESFAAIICVPILGSPLFYSPGCCDHLDTAITTGFHGTYSCVLQKHTSLLHAHKGKL